MNKLMLRVYPVVVLLLFVLASTSPMASVTPPGPPVSHKVYDAQPLPVVGSLENLRTLLSKAQSPGVYRHRDMGLKSERMVNTTFGAGQAAKSIREPQENAKDFSTTNVQVQGVDEADVVKTDGKYIYQVNNNRVIIAEAYPAKKLKIANILKFDDGNFTPSELYIDETHLVVIGNTYYDSSPPAVPAPTNPEGTLKPEKCPPIFIHNTVKGIIYDIRDKSSIKKLREIELEGDYVSSRKVGSALYLVANKYIDVYRIMDPEPPAPAYRDSAGRDRFVGVDYPDIRYFPGPVEPNYLMIAALNLDKPDKEVQVSTYLGSGEAIYASEKNLYVAVSQYRAATRLLPNGNIKMKRQFTITPMPDYKTAIFQFALDEGQSEYKGRGEVPGTILNQFSMDEDKGFFRIATTQGEIWRNDEYTSKNNVYVLDEGLKITGKIEDIAPGEKIYSVRFMGDRGYMVTFKKVDPLFVLDFKDPQAPKILGTLKIPGYSDYLHPYDENHIIGFGKDTVEMEQEGGGKNLGTMAFYQGMKVAVFDVSDVQHPVEMFKEIIGDRGTDSELLHNHKALLFARDKNLLAFPVTVMEIKNKKAENAGVPEYGEFTFQGAYVYNIDLINGFRLKGRITHIDQASYEKSGYGWYNGVKNVDRILYIDDTLYTLSKGMIKAHDIAGLKEKSSLEIIQ